MARPYTWHNAQAVAQQGHSRRLKAAVAAVDAHPMRPLFKLEALYGQLRAEADERWPSREHRVTRLKIELCANEMLAHFERVRLEGLRAKRATLAHIIELPGGDEPYDVPDLDHLL